MSREAVELLFRTFARRFTTKWLRNFEDPKARALWARDLAALELRDEDVDRGLRRCVDLEWPPSPGEFARLCRPADEDLGIPDESAALREAAASARPGEWAQHQWTHPIVYHVAAAVGTWNLSHLPEADVRKLWAYHWHQLAKRVRAGEQLGEPPPRALPERIERRSPEVARAALAEARALLARSR